MISIRLTRVGKKKDGSFRVVVIDSKEKIKAGNYLEMVGSYDPRIDKATLDAARIKHWIQNGAKPSDTVHNLLVSNNIIEGKKINVLPRKIVEKKDEPAADAAVPTAVLAAETAEEKAEETPADTNEAVAEAPAEAADADATAGADAGASAGGDGGASA